MTTLRIDNLDGRQIERTETVRGGSAPQWVRWERVMPWEIRPDFPEPSPEPLAPSPYLPVISPTFPS